MNYADTIPTFQEWVEKQEQGQSSSRGPRGGISRAKKPKEIHNVLNEPPPDHDWYKMKTKSMQNMRKEIMDKLINALSKIDGNIDELNALEEFLKLCKTGPKRARVVISLIGEQGLGKSTLINALLGRPDLAAVSGATKACTQHATTYEHLPGAPDNSKASNIKICIRSSDERRRHAKEQIHNYRAVYPPVLEKKTKDKEDGRLSNKDTVNPISDPTTSDTIDQDNLNNDDDIDNQPPGLINQENFTRELTAEDRRLAQTALEFFKVIWRTGNDVAAEDALEKYLGRGEISNELVLTHCLAKQKQILQDLKAEKDEYVLFCDVPDKAESPEESDMKKVRATAAGIWPLVDMVIVSTGSRLLRNGIVLVDLPGYGDLDHNRTAITNRVRRSADYEMVVAQALRIHTNRSVQTRLQSSIHAHGVNRTILVVNRCDTYETDDLDMEELFFQDTQPFLRPIKNALDALDNLDEDQSNPYFEDAYRNYLLDLAESAIQQYKIAAVAEEVKNSYGQEMHAFGLTSTSYIEWLNPHRKRDPKYLPMMTGVPEMVRFLLNLTADKNLQNYRELNFTKLPAIYDRIKRFVKKEKDDGRYKKFLIKLNKELIPRMLELNKSNVSAVIQSSVEPILELHEMINIKRRVQKTISGWSNRRTTRWITYDYILRNRGIPLHSRAFHYIGKDVNWNRQLLEVIEPSLDDSNSNQRFVRAWKDKMAEKAEAMSTRISSTITHSCQTITTALENSTNQAYLRSQALDAWKDTRNNLNELFQSFPQKLRESALIAYREVTIEEDTKCTIAILNASVYASAASSGGKGDGFYARQEETLITCLERPLQAKSTFVERYQDAAMRTMKKYLDLQGQEFIASVRDELNEFALIAASLLEDKDYKTTHHEKARKILLRWLPEFQNTLLGIQRMFPGEEGLNEVLVTKAVHTKAREFLIKMEEGE